jgi:hypothetical protein
MRLHVSQQSEGQGYSQELAKFRRSRLIVTTAAILPFVFLVWRQGQGDQRDHAPRGFLPEPARDRGRPGSSWQGMYQRGLAVLRPGIWHVAIAAGTTQSEAVLWCDSEAIAWRDWDVTATNWIAWKWDS